MSGAQGPWRWWNGILVQDFGSRRVVLSAGINKAARNAPAIPYLQECDHATGLLRAINHTSPNALAILCAPELLDVCRTTLKRLYPEEFSGIGHIRSALEDIIAKAGG